MFDYLEKTGFTTRVGDELTLWKQQSGIFNLPALKRRVFSIQFKLQFSLGKTVGI